MSPVTLLVVETSRSGEVEVRECTYGNLEVVTGFPVVTGIATAATADFAFEIENVKGGKFAFDMSKMDGEMKKSVTLESSAGSLTLTVVIVHPFAQDMGAAVDVDLSSVVKIGHRGSGANVVSKEFCENSIEGLCEAYKSGARFVEFDVQLASDDTPVIYHDFYLKLKEKSNVVGEPLVTDDKDEKPYHYAIRQFTPKQFSDTGLLNPWHLQLPTFADVMNNTPKGLGFDVEMKYPFHHRYQGIMPYAERNMFVDRTLADLAEFGTDRKLFFSSFDIFVVMMLCLKQHKWPVLQLMTVELEEGEDIEVFVNKSLAVAPLLKKLGVRGYVLNSLHMLKTELTLELPRKLMDMGFMVFTYGEPNNTNAGVCQQLDMGISGICTDKMNDLNVTLDGYRAPAGEP